MFHTSSRPTVVDASFVDVANAAETRPTVFVPAPELGRDGWQPWVDAFAAAGYTPYAPTEQVRNVAARLQRLTSQLDRSPIVIGYSEGAATVQQLLHTRSASAGVAIAAPDLPATRKRRSNRGPLLIVGAGEDRIVRPVETQRAFQAQCRCEAITEFVLFPARGHGFVTDPGWVDVAHYTLAWLAFHGLDRTH